MKPRRRASRKKKPRRSRFFSTRMKLGALACAILILGLWWGLQRPGSHPPAYEEALPAGPAAHTLPEMDQAVFAALEKAGVEPETLRIKHGDRTNHEITVLKAHLAPGGSLKKAAKQISRSLSHNGVKVAHRAKGAGLVLEVSLGGRTTHRVLLLPSLLKPKATPHRPRVALLIDDLGYDLQAAKELEALGIPLTMAVLPHSPHARDIAKLAHAKGLQVMLHLPMEPQGYPEVDPGPGALLLGMSTQELVQKTTSAINSVPHAAGANNHMGSRFTRHPAQLIPVLATLKKRGLFFVDSYTSRGSKGLSTARRLGLSAARRGIFLDNQPTPQAVGAQIERLIKLARQKGAIIAIAHPHPGTIKALRKWAPILNKKTELVLVSELVRPRIKPKRRADSSK